MKQEDKELLLRDLCARLPYNVRVEYKGEPYDVLGIAHGRVVLCKPFMSCTLDEHPLVEEVRPYLFPIESMTEEQEYQCREVIASSCNHYEVYDWFHKKNLDYRDLIKHGLGKDATNLNIYGHE